MSDSTAPAKKSLVDKLTSAAVVGAGIVGAAAVIPQDEVMKRLPSFWEAVKGIAHLNWLRLEDAAKRFRPIAFAWGEKLWSVIKWWALVSAALVAAGIEVKTRLGSSVGHVLVAGGAISFAALGMVLFALTDGIASILFFKFRLAGNALGKVTSLVGFDLMEALGLPGKHATQEEIKKAEAKIAKFHNRIKLILAGTVVLCFSLLFTMLFPEWSTLGWTLIFWAMVAVALCAAIYLDLQMGKAVEVVFYTTLAMIVLTFVLFLLDRLTGGALGFGGFQKWLVGRNRSQIITALLVVIPVTLLLVGTFSKEKDRKESFRQGSKYVGIGNAILFFAFLYGGTITWPQLWGREVPKAVSEVAEKIENASIYSTSEDGKAAKPNASSAPQGSASGGGKYLSRSQMDAIVQPSDDVGRSPTMAAPPSPKAAKQPRRARKPLPKEEPKRYSNLTQGLDELEALGY